MKKFVFIFLLICVTTGTAFAQFWKKSDFKGKRKIEKSGIMIDDFYEYWETTGCYIVDFSGPDDHARNGPPVYYIKDNNEQRRFPDLRNGQELLKRNIKFIRTGPNQTIEILVSKEPTFFTFASMKCRLFIIQPNSEVEFNIKGEAPIILNPQGYKLPSDSKKLAAYRVNVNVDKVYGFVLRKGSMDEDVNFATASRFDEVMSMYSNVSEEAISKNVESKRKEYKTDYALANAMIMDIATGSALFGALTGAAPIWMLPTEFATNMVQNLLHAQMAYAVACSFKNKPESGTDEFKEDLYVLFAGEDIAVTLRNVANASGKASILDVPLELLSKDKLLTAIGNSKAFTAAVQKSGILSKVASKFTAKGIAGAIPVISVVKGFVCNGKDALDFGAQARQYYDRKPEPFVVTAVTVFFDGNGGGKPRPTSNVFIVDNEYGQLPTVSRRGYSFDGWYTRPEGGTKIEPTTKVADTKAACTLYAHWNLFGVKVSFEPTGGDKPSFADKGVQPGSAYGELPTVTKKGYIFDGWYTDNTGGTKVDAKTTVTNSSAHRLYAHWIADVVKVTFDPNGGDKPSSETMNITRGSAYGRLPTVARAGHSFAGWHTAAKGGSPVDASTTVPAGKKDHTLYAQWTTNGITVTFEPNGGDKPSFADKGVQPGSTYGGLPTVSRIGYIFDGWFTEAKGGTKVEEKTTMTTSRSHKLYAHWSGKPDDKSNLTTAVGDSFFPTKAGVVLTYANNDAKGNTTGYSVLTIKDVKGSGRNMTVTFVGTGLDNNRKPIQGAEFTYHAVIKDGVLIMDINQLIPAEMGNLDIKVNKGVPIEYPSDLKPGQSLKPSEITMTMDVSGMKVETVLKIVGKCLSIEDVRVPAGTFKCHKITQTATTTVMGTTNVSTTTEWLAPGIGQVKSEHYDDKNKLVSTSVLVGLKGK